MRSLTSSAGTRSMGVVVRLFLTVFFGIFLAAGLFFAWMLAQDIGKSLAPWFWVKTDCVIVESAVREDAGKSGKKWRAEIVYRYTAPIEHITGPEAGGTRTSAQVAIGGIGGGAEFEDPSEAYRLVRRFPADSRAVCYVERGAGGGAVLIRSTPWIALTILFPLIFVAVGGGGIVAIWWPWRKSAPSHSLSQKVLALGRGRGLLLLRGFFFIFFAAGAIFGYAMFVRPVWTMVQARSWAEVPCRIVSSRVKTHHDSDGSTYSVDIRYRYEVGGERFEANRYSFFTASSSGTKGKRAIVNQYKAGSRNVCFVNPGDPTDAVLQRGPVAGLWFGLIPAVFIAVGLLGMLFVKPSGSRSNARGVPMPARARTATIDPNPLDLTAMSGPVTLTPGKARRTKFLGLLAFAIFWNAFIGIFVYFVIFGDAGAPIFVKGIIALFALIGLALAGAAFVQFLALFNPVVSLALDADGIPLGGEMRFDWQVAGRAARIRRLRIFLEGREEATYRRGTDTSTDKSVFTTLEMVESGDAGGIRFGSGRLTIPADSMHSFEASNNKIVWCIRVKGDIPRWPDIDDEHPIIILPQAPRI